MGGTAGFRGGRGGRPRPRLPFQADRPPRPAGLGEWRLRVRDRDPPDAVLPVGQGQPRELPAEPCRSRGLWHEQRQLLAGRLGRATQLQLQPLDRGRRRLPFQPREQQALDGLGVRGGFRKALLDLDPRRRPPRGEGQVQLQGQVRAVRGESPGGELGRDRGHQPVEHEPQRLEVLDRRLDGQREGQSLGGMARPERLGLLATRPRVEPSSLVPEPGDQRRARELRHRPDLAQPEPGQSSADVEVRRQEAGRVRGEERGLVAGRDRDRGAGTGVDRGDGRGEVRAGHPGPHAQLPGESATQRRRDPLDEHRLGPPQRPQAIDPHLEQPERGLTRVATPRQTRAERAERLERDLGRRPVRVGIGLDEGRLRDEPVGAPQRHAAPDAQALERSGRRR